MKFVINTDLSEKYSDLTFGVIIAKNVDNSRKNSALKQLLTGLTVQTQKKFKGVSLKELPNISKWRAVFNEISAKSYKTLVEEVLNRAINKNEVLYGDNLSNIRDYMMLKWQLPIMCFSLDDIYGDLVLEYEDNSIYYKDQGNKLTKKWNLDQEARGKANNETKNVLFLIENLGIISDEELQEKMNEFASMLKKYTFPKEVEIDILKSPKKEKELGVVGLSELKESVEDQKEQKEPYVFNPEVKEPADYANEVIKTEEPQQAESPKQPSQTKSQQIDLDTGSLKFKIQQLLKEAAEKVFPDADLTGLKAEYPRDKEHGDYACSVALKLAKQLSMNPMEVAEKIIEKIEPVQFIEKAEAAAPGFINIRLSKDWLESKIADYSKGEMLYDNTLGKNNNVVIDYSHPNIAKPLGVHHLLSTIIGQSIYNIYKSLGFNTIGVNHLGDWGTQFGKLIYAYKTWGDKRKVEKNPIPELLKLYVKFHDEAEQNPEIEDKGRFEFKKLEEGDEENTKLWEWIKDLSLLEIQKAYKILDIQFDEYMGESFYNDKMQPIIEDGKNRGIFTEGEGGSLIYNFNEEDVSPVVIQKSDGATLYMTRDIATLAYRIDTWNPVKILYVVDSAQSLHFKQLFVIGEKLGYTSAHLEHVSFGRMRLPDKSMSTRKGNVVLLEDLLKDGVNKAKKIVKEKSKKLKKKEQEAVANMIAVGAIKYNVLSQNRTTEISFDWDRMLSTEGNSAPYLQYVAARADSILRKAEKESGKAGKKAVKKGKKKAEEENEMQIDLFQAIEHVEKVNKESIKPLEDPLEYNVARMLIKFQEYLVMAAEEYKPNLLSNYLYDLAQAFNSFYNTVPVIQAENEEVKEARLILCQAVSNIMKEGLKILGIKVPERM